MAKESNGVTMHSAAYANASGSVNEYRHVHPSERDTDPDITQDYITVTPVLPPAPAGFFGRLRMQVARVLARLSWRIMP